MRIRAASTMQGCETLEEEVPLMFDSKHPELGNIRAGASAASWSSSSLQRQNPSPLVPAFQADSESFASSIPSQRPGCGVLNFPPC